MVINGHNGFLFERSRECKIIFANCEKVPFILMCCNSKNKTVDSLFKLRKNFCWTKNQSVSTGSTPSLVSDGFGGGVGDCADICNLASCSKGRHHHHDGAEDGDSSVDSGHGGTGRSRSKLGVKDALGFGEEKMRNGSPLIFDPQHFSHSSALPAGRGTQTQHKVLVDVSPNTDEFRHITTVERLVKTNSIWLLASLSRAGAVHILKDRDTGNFIVRKSSQPQSLALSVQSRLCGHPAVDHYLIQGSNVGFRLEGSAHAFHSIPALIGYYIENIDEIPYHLRLPVAIQQAKSTRELASLDMLGQDFWSSPLSRKSPLPEMSPMGTMSLPKSQSEPINIQRQMSTSNSAPFFNHQGQELQQIVDNTPPSHSTDSLSHFIHTQAEMERYFAQRLQVDKLSRDSTPLADNPLPETSVDSRGEIFPSDVIDSKNNTSPNSLVFHSSVNVTDITQITDPEPIYSVSKKQIKTALTKHLDSQDKPNDEIHHSNPDLPPPLPPMQYNLYEEDDVCQAETNSLPALSHGMSASWDPSLSLEEAKLADGKARAWTHPREETMSQSSSNRPKANLYFTTNLDLLEIPESTYFTSTLSDKLSDYEDIWRTSSCAESDHEATNREIQQKHSKLMAAKMISDPRSVLDARIGQFHQQQTQLLQPQISKSPIQSKDVAECAEADLVVSPATTTTAAALSVKAGGKRKILRKTSRDTPPSRRIFPAARDSVTGGSTGLTALEQARRFAGSTSDEDNGDVPTSPLSPHQIPPPIAHVKGIRRLADGVFDYPDQEGVTSEAVDREPSHVTPVIMTPTTCAISATTSKSLAVSKTAVVTNTNSIRILPSRPNQIKFVTSHSLDFSSSNITARHPQHLSPELSTTLANTTAAYSRSLTPTPTSTKSLPGQLAIRNIPTCVLTTTMSVIMSEPNTPKATSPTPDQHVVTSNKLADKSASTTNKGKYPTKNGGGGSKLKEKLPLFSQLTRLSRLKSSSESSLATVSSPLYAEPVDAVKLRDKQDKSIKVHTRRQSAPSGPQHFFQNPNQPYHGTPTKVSQNPALETIFSPGFEENSKENHKTGQKFTFDDDACHGSTSLTTAIPATASSSKAFRASITRSQSMQEYQPSRPLERKHSWKDRLNRLKLGTRVLTRNLNPSNSASSSRQPIGTSIEHATQTPEDMGSNLFNELSQGVSHPEGVRQVASSAPSSTLSPGKFPIVEDNLLNLRDSCFSESSTVQDLISSVHPELHVRPIQPSTGVIPQPGMASHGTPAAPSEYDNLGIYTASSVGTVYSPPWDSSLTSRLIQESLRPSPLTVNQQSHLEPQHLIVPPPLPINPPPDSLHHQKQPLAGPLSTARVTSSLPPAMNFHERIARWQESNTTYLHQKELRLGASGSPNVHAGFVSTNSNANGAVTNGLTVVNRTFHHETSSSYHQEHHSNQQERAHQKQLLHHQHQLRNNPVKIMSHKNDVSNVDSNNMCQNRKDLLDQGGKQSQSCQQSKMKRQLSEPQHPVASATPKSPMTFSPVSSRTLARAYPSSPTIISTPFHSNSASNAQTTISPTSPSHRLSSVCPDVVHCHSTPVPPTTPSSPSVLNPSSPREDFLTTPNMVGEDDILFGGSMVLAGSELQQKISPVFSSDYTMSQTDKAPGTKIREYIFKLSCDRNTTFGSTIENFIQCTIESQERNPQHVLRNVRQFMTGIKNYLVKHGEGMLEDLIERERSKLGANEILNIDAIIEQALHVCVLKPLKYHIYHLFVEKYNENKALEQLSRNIKYARTKSAEDLGVKPSLSVPESTDMEVIKYYLDLMQRSYSPLQKLQNLLKATSTIYRCVQSKDHQFPNRGPSSLGADDFLPMLIYVLVHCGLVAAEIEADFMWGLLQPSLLTGEGGYYLTTLSSAVLVLKNFQETHDIPQTQLEGQLPTLSDMQGFLKIAIPDEFHDSINWKTLPVRPNMNTRDVCALVAHKFKVTNPQDYGLYLLCDGQESQMAESDCPQIIKGDYQAAKKKCFFAFKRLDANIAWPRQMEETSSMVTDSI